MELASYWEVSIKTWAFSLILQLVYAIVSPILVGSNILGLIIGGLISAMISIAIDFHYCKCIQKATLSLNAM